MSFRFVQRNRRTVGLDLVRLVGLALAIHHPTSSQPATVRALRCAEIARHGAIPHKSVPAAVIPEYPVSIQEAIDANPGRMVFVPAGDYTINTSIEIRNDNAGLYGPGRLIQTNPDVPIIEISNADGVRLQDLTLTRASGKMDVTKPAVLASECRNLTLDGVQVIDNRLQGGAITIDRCAHIRITNCLVQNYMRIAVDDRTDSPDHGYAFNCLDGTGIALTFTTGALLQGNRVVESNYIPTREMMERHGFGKIIKKNEVMGALCVKKYWDMGYAPNWHQGSAIVVTSPENTDYIQILGNYIENAAQGVDIHADHVIMSHNIINNAFIGMKAMHGSRNVIITDNQFSKNDLWSIALMPGAASRAAGVPIRPTENPETSLPNVDGGSIIAYNVISDFGYGNARWMWLEFDAYPLRFNRGQKPDNPPLTDVIVQGNIVYDTGHDQVLVHGIPTVDPPRYKYAVLVEGNSDGKQGPIGIRFSNNVFHPGTDGLSNIKLPQ